MWHIVAIVNHDSSHLILLSDENAGKPTIADKTRACFRPV